jgi:hypothetical protein
VDGHHRLAAPKDGSLPESDLLMAQKPPVPDVVAKLGIPVVEQIPEGFAQVSVPISLASEGGIVESMYSTFRSCPGGLLATITNDCLTFWREEKFLSSYAKTIREGGKTLGASRSQGQIEPPEST